MISLEKTLLGENTGISGDAVKRHQIYGNFCEELHIVIPTEPEFRPKQLAANVFVWPTNSQNKFSYLQDTSKIVCQIHNDKILDLIMAQDLLSSVGAKLQKKLGLPLLISVHGDFLDNSNNLAWLKNKWYNLFLVRGFKKALKDASAVRVVSQGLKDKISTLGVPQDKIHIIHTPVDLSNFITFDNARVNELHQKYPDKNILFVGRLEVEKNLPWFLEVLAQVKNKYPDVNFLIIGEGSQEKIIKNKAQELKIENSVKLVGKINHDDLGNFYHLANLVILPSSSESFGKVLIEASAAATPCVATTTTGAQEIIQDKKTGFLIPHNNIKKMTDKIVLLLEDGELAEQMGQTAQNYIRENYDGDTQIKKMVKLWQQLLI